MKAVEAEIRTHSGTQPIRHGRAFRHAPLRLPFPDGKIGELTHVGWASTGLMDDGPSNRQIMLVAADMETHNGSFLLMEPDEAKMIGESLIRMADEAYREKVFKEE